MEDSESVEPKMFPGRRIMVATRLDRDQKGDMRLIADIKAKGTNAGYFKNDDYQVIEKPGKLEDLESDIPF